MATNEAKIVFKGDASNAVTAVGRLKTELSALQAVSAKALSFGGVLATGAAVSGLVVITKRAIDTGDAFAKMSQKTGVAVEDLSKLQYAAGLSGVASESLQKGLVSLAAATVEASEGSGIAGEAITKLGVKVRGADGSMRSSIDVLYDLADQFQSMPDGVEKTNYAVDIFGKRLGADMIPLLNSGSEGLRAMGDEAERLGIVMSAELAKKSEEFNDNLERLSKLSESAGIKIANALIPALNELIVEYLDAGKAGLTFWESITGIGLSDPTKGPAAQIASITEEIEKLRKAMAGEGISKKRLAEFGMPDNTAEIERLEKLRKYYELQQERQTGDGVASAKDLAAKRERIERDLQAKLAEIAKLRGIAEGKVSADILDTDDKRVAAQIKNAEKLRDALSTAWKSALKDAESAGEAAAKLFDQAAGTRQSGADRAAEKRRGALSPEDQQAEIQKEFDSAASTASNAAAQARYAEMFGRTENAAKLAKEAERAAEKAARLADQIDDPELSARAIEQAAEIQAQLLEAQARQKQADQAAYQKQAEITAATIAQLDEQITALQTKAAALKVEADIEQAKVQIAQLQAQLENLKDKTITVTVRQVDTGGAPLGGTDQGSPVTGGATGTFAAGGFTGPGGKWQPAGIVHKGEYVLRQEVVRQRGALALLERLNRYGISAIPGYANGGLVGNIRIPSISPRAMVGQSSSGTPINLYLDGHRIPVTAEPDVASTLTTLFAREALKRGRP